MILQPELIKDGVVKVDVSSIGTKFEGFVQAGCRDLGSHRSRNVYCRKPIILPNLVLFFGTILELPLLPSFTCGSTLTNVELLTMISYDKSPLAIGHFVRSLRPNL